MTALPRAPRTEDGKTDNKGYLGPTILTFFSYVEYSKLTVMYLIKYSSD